MPKQKEILKQLIHECMISESDLAFVDRFNSFILVNESDESIKLECQSQIGFIYAYHQMYEKAITYFLPLMQKRKETEDFHFSNLLLDTLKSLSSLKRLEEAKTLFDQFITDKCISNFYQMEAMLLWLVQTFDPSEPELAIYEDKLNKLMNDLGYRSAKVTRKEKILDVHAVHRKSNHTYSEIVIEYGSKPKSEAIAKLKKFISSNPPGFYLKLAQDHIAELQEKCTSL